MAECGKHITQSSRQYIFQTPYGSGNSQRQGSFRRSGAQSLCSRVRRWLRARRSGAASSRQFLAHRADYDAAGRRTQLTWPDRPSLAPCGWARLDRRDERCRRRSVCDQSLRRVRCSGLVQHWAISVHRPGMGTRGKPLLLQGALLPRHRSGVSCSGTRSVTGPEEIGPSAM